MTHSCEQTQSDMLDLIYEEPLPQRKEELRLEISRCPDCQEIFQDMERTRQWTKQMPPLSLGDDLDARILAAAKEAAMRPAFIPNLQKTKDATSPSTWLVYLLKGMKPTVSVSLLVVVSVTTFFLMDRGQPKKSEQESTAIGQMVENSTVTTANAPRPSEGTADPMVASRQKTTASASGETHDMVLGRASSAPLAAPAKTEDGKGKPFKPGAPPSESKKDQVSPAKPTMFSVAPTTQAPTQPALEARPEADDMLSSLTAGGAMPSAAPLNREEIVSGEASVALSEEKQENELSFYDQGMNDSAAGNCHAAIQSLGRAIRELSPGSAQMPRALHHLARCEKQLGRCGSALPTYSKVIDKYPQYPDRPRAILESATCSAILGQVAEARRKLLILQGIPGYRDVAGEELRRLE